MEASRMSEAEVKRNVDTTNQQSEIDSQVDGDFQQNPNTDIMQIGDQ